MATFDDTRPLLDALSAPLGALIAAVGHGVAEAQREMDAASISSLREIYANDEGLFLELQRIGYRPTWYHIPEAEGELQVALTVTGQEATGAAATPQVRGRVKLYAAPVDAAYASRFNFSLQASSRVRFRIVPVPPGVAADALQVVPVVVGLTVAEARARLQGLGIAVAATTAAEGAVVTTQTPDPGTMMEPGTAVALGTA